MSAINKLHEIIFKARQYIHGKDLNYCPSNSFGRIFLKPKMFFPILVGWLGYSVRLQLRCVYSVIIIVIVSVVQPNTVW